MNKKTNPPSQAARPITVLLVDDHQVVRVGLSTLLNRTAEFEVVGSASSVAAAIAKADELRPEVILMDLRLPDGTGVDACREILSNAPATRILFFTSFADEEAVLMTVMSGAAGCLVKDVEFDDLVKAIHDVVDGVSIIDPKLERPVREQVRRSIDELPMAVDAESLSPQERRILSLVVEGSTNKEIAAALGISDKTVKNYLSNAFQKLQVRRRAQAAAVFSKLHPGTRPA